MIETNEQLISELARNIESIKGFGVERIGLFGSFARARQNVGSDIDLLVEFSPGAKSFDNFMKLSFFLEDLTGRKVDLVTRESLSPHIGPKILAEVEYGIID